ncbi:MAG: hypothetical protein PHQ74_04550 [Crocinitomicaceae bacterium]|nr:hypothetical protein [Crocinitomicaceae bacterium]
MDLVASLSNQDFVLKTQRQISKDFNQHGFEFEPQFDTQCYEIGNLRVAVQEMLLEVMEKQPSKWMPLMYTIDIPEKQYLKFVSDRTVDWIIDFTFLVIKREAQKVFFRESFK